jgi:hypothetical protein
MKPGERGTSLYCAEGWRMKGREQRVDRYHSAGQWVSLSDEKRAVQEPMNACSVTTRVNVAGAGGDPPSAPRRTCEWW